MGVARLALGGIFLWAFLDKLFGLGYSTPAARAWLNAGSPTKGYLSSSTGPLEGLFKAIAGNPVTDALFMLGLLAVGACLLLGVGVRVVGASGALMMALMYASHPPWTAATPTNPLIDDHVVYAAVLLAFAFSHAGRYLGLGGCGSAGRSSPSTTGQSDGASATDFYPLPPPGNSQICVYRYTDA